MADAPNLDEAIRSLLSPIAKMATFAVGLSAFAYFVGWQYLRGYYSQLGASWVLSQITPTEFIFTAIGGLVFAVVLAGCLLYVYSEGGIKRRGLVRLLMWSIATALVSGAVHYAINRWWEGVESYWIILSGAALGICIAAIPVISIASIAEGYSTAGKEAYYLYCYFLLSVVGGLIQQIGEWRATSDLMDSEIGLPSVTLSKDDRQCHWFLVRMLGGDKLLLADRALVGGKPNLRVVEFGETALITPYSKSSCRR